MPVARPARTVEQAAHVASEHVLPGAGNVHAAGFSRDPLGPVPLAQVGRDRHASRGQGSGDAPPMSPDAPVTSATQPSRSMPLLPSRRQAGQTGRSSEWAMPGLTRTTTAGRRWGTRHSRGMGAAWLAPPARVVLLRSQPAVPGYERRWADGEDFSPAPAGHEPCQRCETYPVGGSYRTRPECRRGSAFSCRSTGSSASFAPSPRNTRTARPGGRPVSR